MNRYIEIDKSILGEIYTSREVMDNLEVLCDDLGSRFAGTADEKKAADFIAEKLTDYGLSNVHLEPYQYNGWRRGEATLTIESPIKKRLPCISLPYCMAADIEGELVDLNMGTPEDFERQGEALAGNIALVSSRSPHRLGRWIHRKEKYERAALKGASVFIFVSENPGLGPETGSLRDDGNAPIPGISVGLEEGAFLKRLMRRKGAVKMRVKTTDINEPMTSWNVVGDLQGGDPDHGVTMLGCHYDGHDIAQGALDPASGMVAVMEAARVLSKCARDRLKGTVRFVAWGTEELGLIGAHRYVLHHRDELDDIRFYFNMDSAGGPWEKGVVLHLWPELAPFFLNAVDEMAMDVPVGHHLGGSSDHFPFFLHGVPTGGMGDPTGAPTGRGFGHTRYDTLDKIVLSDLRDAAACGARLAVRIANAQDFPAKRRGSDIVNHIVKTHPNLEAYRVSIALKTG
jgi:Iap family predicted aminopeptidase